MTTGMGDCAGLDEAACKANAACMPIVGAAQNVQKKCLEAPMFIECAPSMACGDALTVACSPQKPPKPVQFPDTCIPSEWMSCDFPVLDMPCK